MPRKVLSDLDFNGVAKVTGLTAPTSSSDAATKTYVDTQIAAAVAKMPWKDDVRVASTVNINLASPGASIDGVAMSAGDRFLAKDQTTTSENGIYVWNGAAVAATRATDFDGATELEAAVVPVEEGTSNAGTRWYVTTQNPTIGSAIAFAAMSSSSPAATTTVAGLVELATQAEVDTAATSPANLAVTPQTLGAWAGRKLKSTGTVGNASATQFDIAHNFGTRDVHVEVYRTATPWDTILCDVERPDANTVRVRFAAAPAANEYTVVVLG